MNITISFRQMDASQAVKSYAREKFSKIQKLLRQPLSVRVTVSLEKLVHIVEASLSSGGSHFEAKDSSDDMYVTIDRVVAKLERQVRASKGASSPKRTRRTIRALDVTEEVGEEGDVQLEEVVKPVRRGRRSSVAPAAVVEPAASVAEKTPRRRRAAEVEVVAPPAKKVAKKVTKKVAVKAEPAAPVAKKVAKKAPLEKKAPVAKKESVRKPQRRLARRG
jgi:putative sigma-54 modulation protein